MTISDEQLDALLEEAVRDLQGVAGQRRRETVACHRWHGMWIIVKRWHRPGHPWDGLFVAQTSCGLFEGKRPKVSPELAIAAAKQHITTMHVKTNDCLGAG